ncbi:MAG: PIN domain-containing protein [Candidatus Anammoxibacter sp.]
MGLVLDSAVLISAERKKLDLPKLLMDQSATETVLISVITASELLHGCERAKDERIRKKRIEFVEGLLNHLPIVDFGPGEARKHAELWAILEEKGIWIGAHDMMIAATCLSIRANLATLNEREFSRVEGLKLVNIKDYLL